VASKHSFYLPGGGLPRGGMSAIVGHLGTDAWDVDDAEDPNAPDAVSANETLIHRLAVMLASPASNVARASLQSALEDARRVIAIGPGDDAGDEVNTLRVTVARVEAALGNGNSAVGTALPAATAAAFPWGLVLLLGGGGLLLWWLAKGGSR